MSRPQPFSLDAHREAVRAADLPRRNHVGTVSLAAAVIGAAACQVGLVTGPFTTTTWLPIVSAGFQAALVGGLADWFAVTALFRHPLGIPIPHTAIIPEGRAKIIEGIVSMVEDEWLSPDVIGARLMRLAPSDLIVEWLRDPAHVERLGAPLRDVLHGLARMLTEPETVGFVERTLQGQLRDVPLDASAGRWLSRVAGSDGAATAFESMARSLVSLIRRPGTADHLQVWLERSAEQLHKEGKRLVPLILRRKIVQRKVVEAICDYFSAELHNAAGDRAHPWRRFVFDAVDRLAARLANGDAEALAQAEQLRTAVLESLEAGPIVLDMLRQLRRRLEDDLSEPRSDLSNLVDRMLRGGIVDVLSDAKRRAAFDEWIRHTADDLLRRHHHEIGLTVREHLEALETQALVAQIEARIGADLQFIRLNGALVGGLIGVLIALAHQLAG